MPPLGQRSELTMDVDSVILIAELCRNDSQAKTCLFFFFFLDLSLLRNCIPFVSCIIQWKGIIIVSPLCQYLMLRTVCKVGGIIPHLPGGKLRPVLVD